MFGVNAAGESWRTGGWGHVLGDEGSGYWLGLHGMKAALQHRDGSGPETALLDAAVAFYRLEAVEDLQALVYGKPLTKTRSPPSRRRSRRRPRQAIAWPRRCSRRLRSDLAVQTRAPIEKLGLAGAFKVALVGGVFTSGDLLRDPFEALSVRSLRRRSSWFRRSRPSADRSCSAWVRRALPPTTIATPCAPRCRARWTDAPVPLAICATPIGNLEDVTLRVLRELGEADLVLCEDTRRTRILLDRHGISARLVELPRAQRGRPYRRAAPEARGG